MKPIPKTLSRTIGQAAAHAMLNIAMKSCIGFLIIEPEELRHTDN
ncbi:MAG: hypothetical protein QXH32_06135 [Candidatus Caldarchaeum sp.]